MFMLDTDMCIHLINEREEALRERFEANAADVVISSITYAELCYGVAHSQRIESNARELEAFRRDLDVLPFDADAGAHYGEIRHVLTRRGRSIGANDLLIAAHARCVAATLVTNNEAGVPACAASEGGELAGRRSRLRPPLARLRRCP